MGLSPLDSIIPNFGGAPTLQDFDVDPARINTGQRIAGSNRQYKRFYRKVFTERIADDVRINPKTGSEQVLKYRTEEVAKEMVLIVTPGDKNVYDGEVLDFHKREHWQEYKAFREGKAVPLGTPVTEAEWIGAPIATELMIYGCHTVEQLADSSDLLCQNIPQGFEPREYARAVCESNQKNKTLDRVNAQQVKIDALEKELAEMREFRSKLILPEGSAYPMTALGQDEIIKKKGRPKKIIVPNETGESQHES